MYGCACVPATWQSQILPAGPLDISILSGIKHPPLPSRLVRRIRPRECDVFLVCMSSQKHAAAVNIYGHTVHHGLVARLECKIEPLNN